MSNEYRIIFTKRNTMATTFSPAPAGQTYFLKAKSQRSAQHVGYATVISPKHIEVTTVSGKKVGVATSRSEARQMIDTYHRTNNSNDYWMWVGATLVG